MPYLLDTNVCVDYLTGRYPAVIDRMRRASPDDLRLSAIVVAELRFGADRSANRKANHGRIDVLVAEIECLDFDLEGAAAYGRVRAALEAAGDPIGPHDMLIGAHALAKGLTLVTDNLREFRRIRGLTVESWRTA